MTRIDDILIRAADRLTDEAWTQHAMARDNDGEETDTEDVNAVQWCVVGAVDRESQGIEGLHDKNHSHIGLRAVVDAVGIDAPPDDCCPEHYLTDWNDDEMRNAAEVREALYRAAWQLTEVE